MYWIWFVFVQDCDMCWPPAAGKATVMEDYVSFTKWVMRLCELVRAADSLVVWCRWKHKLSQKQNKKYFNQF